MIEVGIRDGDGNALNARVEVGDSRIVLHSRSGAKGPRERNPDYSRALQLILSRLEQVGCLPTIYLDSEPVQHEPLQARLLASPADLKGPIQEQFEAIVRASNRGSRSHGAYRRLLLQTPKQPAFSLAAIITDSFPKGGISGLPAAVLRRVQRSDIETAIESLQADPPRWHSFGPPAEYWLVTSEGRSLPAKAVFGLALGEALGTYTHSYLFKSGPGQAAFKVMREAGFEIERSDSHGRRHRLDLPGRVRSQVEIEAAVRSISATDEEKSWIEGNPRIVNHLRRERASGLARKKKAAVRAENGELRCEHCNVNPIESYGPEGEVCIEVHHLRPIGEMGEGGSTTLDDLQCLCANCHRVIHKEMALGRR